MKATIKISLLAIILQMTLTHVGYAQLANNVNAPVARALNYVFTSDSLAGFDEPAASAGALANMCFGREYKMYMYIAKRTYVKQKYQLKNPPPVPLTLFKNAGYANRTMSVGGACDNEDFELATSEINAPGSVQGWTVQSGLNPNSCQPPTINGNNNYTVFAGPIIDDKTGLLVASYFDAAVNTVPAGHSFIRLNDASAFGKASKLTKSYIVGPTNSLFEYAYFPVIQGAPHLCCEQPGFNIHITVTNTTTGTFTVLACPQISVAVPSALCQYTPAPTDPVFLYNQDSSWLYHNWSASAIDLTPYIGYQVTFDVVVVDCIYTAHGAYAYFDAKCSPLTVYGNNNAYPAGTPSITLPTCGLNSATICAPDGLGPYTWEGPGIVAPYNIPLNTNQCFTTNISADYTLSMTPPGACNPIDRVITVTITASPYLFANAIQATCGGTSATVSYTAAGSASVNPVIIWSTPPTSTTSGGTNLGTATFPVGTGVVTVTALDPLGCKATATVNINSPPPQPTVSIINVTGSPSITCLTPSLVLSGVSGYTYGTLDYFWSASSFTASGQSQTITVGSPFITLTARDPVSGCVASATTSVRVNTVVPNSSVNPVNQSVNCGAGIVPITCTGTAVSPTTNVTHMWYAPGGAPPVVSGGPSSLFVPAYGTNTFVLVDNVNGCSIAKYVYVTSSFAYPTFSLSSSQSFSIGCSTKSLTSININGGESTATPTGGVISYTVLPPGYSGGTTYSTSSVNIYTINAPGSYTVIVKDNSDLCETRLVVPIIQNTFPPDITASAPAFTLSCSVPSVVLEGYSANGLQGTVLFDWSFQNGGNPGHVLNYSLTVNTNPAIPTNSIINTYSLQITEVNNACINTTVVTMYQNTRPPIARISANSPSLTCRTNSISLTNSSITGILSNFGNGGPIVGLLWTGPTPQLPDSFSSTYYAYTPGIYTLTVEDTNNGCTSQTTTPITDSRVYPILLTNKHVALDCNAATTGGVKLAVTAQSLTPAQVDAQWTLPLPTPNVSGASSLTLTTDGVGEYQLSVTTKSNGCNSEVIVEVSNGVLNGAVIPDKETGFAPLTVNFTNSSSSSSSVTGTSSITSVWSFGNGTTRTTTTNLSTSAVYAAPGSYSVTLFVSKGSCRDTVVKIITVDVPSKLVVPNVFTPNGDDKNDLFFLQSANLTQITAEIFDRWGNKIYELTSVTGNIAWDGKNQFGKEAPDGTYFYTIKATGKDGQNYDTKGTVSLYR